MFVELLDVLNFDVNVLNGLRDLRTSTERNCGIIVSECVSGAFFTVFEIFFPSCEFLKDSSEPSVLLRDNALHFTFEEPRVTTDCCLNVQKPEVLMSPTEIW